MPGFTCFTQPPVVAEPTVKEQVNALPAATKNAILKSYINRKDYHTVSIELGIAESLLELIYKEIDDIQLRCKENLTGETPATTQANLQAAIETEFLEYFTSPIITAILNAMVAWSKHDGTGTFAFYKSNIIL